MIGGQGASVCLYYVVCVQNMLHVNFGMLANNCATNDCGSRAVQALWREYRPERAASQGSRATPSLTRRVDDTTSLLQGSRTIRVCAQRHFPSPLFVICEVPCCT